MASLPPKKFRGAALCFPFSLPTSPDRFPVSSSSPEPPPFPIRRPVPLEPDGDRAGQAGGLLPAPPARGQNLLGWQQLSLSEIPSTQRSSAGTSSPARPALREAGRRGEEEEAAAAVPRSCQQATGGWEQGAAPSQRVAAAPASRELPWPPLDSFGGEREEDVAATAAASRSLASASELLPPP